MKSFYILIFLFGKYNITAYFPKKENGLTNVIFYSNITIF